MNLEQFRDENLLVVTPNYIKLELLNRYNDKLINVKFMSLEEYKNHYYFSYDNKTINYMICKYKYNLDVCKIYLNNLYVIDIDNEYSSKKLNDLKLLKKELIDNNLLYFDNLFNDYINNKKVIVYKYNELEKYEEDMFKDHLIYKDIEQTLNNKKVIKCNTLEDEVLFVVDSIEKLISNGIDFNHIFLTNVGDEYLYTINRVFKYFNIPININMKESIFGTKLVKDYLKTGKIPPINNRITNSLINVLNSLVELESDPNYNLFLIDKLKNTYLNPIKYDMAVNIVDINECVIDDDCYLFVLGFNQESIPKLYKDEDYITDNIKNEVLLYDTTYKNIRSKKVIKNILGSIKNVYLSYKERSNFNNYLPSVFIEEENFIIEEYSSNKIYNSNIYNKLLLNEYLDNYYKYGEVNSNLDVLYNSYNTLYNTYSNSFSGIDNSKFLSYINNHLKVSYTSLNSYNNCAFKYYINYILKINPFTDTFSIFIGNLFHYMFSIMYNEGFDFNLEWDRYLEKRKLTLSELFFLKELKKRLLEDITIIRKQEVFSTYKDRLTEEEINIKLDKNIDVVFTGKIDKIMYKNNINDTYYSVLDYKTGNINTSINNMYYGLDMQLPIYLYLLNKSNLFENPIFTGMYFQRVLFPSYKWEIGKELDNIKANNLKLMGYSTSDVERLYEFDKTYEASELIKSMKINKDLSFSSNSKILSDDDIYNVLKYTESIVSSTVDNMIKGDFSINPKVIDNKKSCEHCEFRDICFVTNKDYVYLENKNSLDFLGGDE